MQQHQRLRDIAHTHKYLHIYRYDGCIRIIIYVSVYSYTYVSYTHIHTGAQEGKVPHVAAPAAARYRRHTYIYTYIYVQIHIYVYSCMYMCMYIHIIHTYTHRSWRRQGTSYGSTSSCKISHTHLYIYIHILHICTNTYIIYACMYMCMYVYTYHTYIYTQELKKARYLMRQHQRLRDIAHNRDDPPKGFSWCMCLYVCERKRGRLMYRAQPWLAKGLFLTCETICRRAFSEMCVCVCVFVCVCACVGEREEESESLQTGFFWCVCVCECVCLCVCVLVLVRERVRQRERCRTQPWWCSQGHLLMCACARVPVYVCGWGGCVGVCMLAYVWVGRGYLFCAMIASFWCQRKSTLQHTTAHCNTLQHTATHCTTLQHTATHCTTLHHAALHCNTHISDASTTRQWHRYQHTATHYNTL